MQAVKSEWTALQAEFASLALSDRITSILTELKALQEMAIQSDISNSDLLHFRLRKVQRYVEWTVPELLPDRAEDAEILVKVSRFAAQFLIQEADWNTSRLTTEVEQQIKQISTICNID